MPYRDYKEAIQRCHSDFIWSLYRGYIEIEMIRWLHRRLYRGSVDLLQKLYRSNTGCRQVMSRLYGGVIGVAYRLLG